MENTDDAYLLAVRLNHSTNPATCLYLFKAPSQNYGPIIKFVSESKNASLTPLTDTQKKTNLELDIAMMQTQMNTIYIGSKKKNKRFIRDPFLTFSSIGNTLFEFNNIRLFFRSSADFHVINLGKMPHNSTDVPDFYASE